MSSQDLMNEISIYNESYRKGCPVIPDEKYDSLLTQLKNLISNEQYDEFRTTLFETIVNSNSKIKHEYTIGSLEKIKYEDKKLYLWCIKYKVDKLFCSYKLDGASFVATVNNGKVTTLATRGDGYYGESLNSKIKYIFRDRYSDFTGTIRGELVLEHDSHLLLGMKNRRNGVVGVIKEDKINPNKLNHVVPYVYQILSSTDTILKQFEILKQYRFNVPEFDIIDVNPDIDETLKTRFFSINQSYDYDGIVISPTTYINENILIPEKQIAYKVNSEGIEATIEKITWNLSKNRKLIPICNITPIDISGTTVSNITGINAKYIMDNKIDSGAIVKIIKSGEIIPKILEVIKPSTTSNIPILCHNCNEHLQWEGVDLVCKTETCSEIKRVEHFIKSSGIERVSEKTLENWRIFSFEDLFLWTPSYGYKSQSDFYKDLQEKVFNQSPENIMRNFYINGIGQTNYDKLLSHFGDFKTLNTVFETNYYESLPYGIGSISISNAIDSWKESYQLLQTILQDDRYEEVNISINERNTMKLEGKSFLITGTLTRGRNIVEAEIKANGGTIASSVSKNLDYLLVGDRPGSKLDKANKLGIKVIFENDYNAMLSI